MNSRGPLPQPDSRRGASGVNGAATDFVQEELVCPSLLKTKKEKAEFKELIADQRAAGVGMRAGDADLYGQYIKIRFQFRQASSIDQMAKARRLMGKLEDQLVIGEYARQRVGIRGKKAAVKGKLALMIAEKNGTDG